MSKSMTLTSMISAPRILALAPIAMLAGCVSFGSEPPPSLLTLTAVSSAPSGSAASATAGDTIRLAPFEAPQRLNVTRVPVQVSDSEIAYLKDAVWVEKPARLLRRLIAETLRTNTGRVVFDGDDAGASAEQFLRGTVRDFGYDARSRSVLVRFDAVRSNGQGGVETRRFEARVSDVSAEVGEVGPSLNVAANDLAEQIAKWMSEA